MKTTWTKGLEGDRKKDITASFAACGLIRARLAEILEEKIQLKFNTMTSEDAFKDPNWELEQAANAKYVRAMKEIIALIS